MPISRKKKYKYKGQIREKVILENTEKKPITVASLAKTINNFGTAAMSRAVSRGIENEHIACHILYLPGSKIFVFS